MKIIESCLAIYGTEEDYNIVEGGEIMTKENITQQFEEYVYTMGVADKVVIEFNENTVAPTSVIHNNIENISRLIIALPISHRINRFKGVLNHEIGTHLARKLNDKK